MSKTECCGQEHARKSGVTHGRRSFIRLAAFGGGAAIYLGSAPGALAGEADALVLSCMDYRLVDDVQRLMDSKGLTNKYDHVVLAGASAGVMHEAFKEWRETFWAHLKLSVDLNAISKVIVVDHRDCDAYKIAYGKEHAKDAAKELELHSEVLALLAGEIRERMPKLKVEAYLMALDGSVEIVRV